MKNHLKRPNSPKTWDILRKTTKFVTRPNPGGHMLEHSIPLVVFMRDMLKKSANAKETRYMITKYDFMVDGKKRNDYRMGIGLMDTVSMPASKEYYRIALNKKGKLAAIKIDEKEASLKLCRVKGKRMHGKKIQVTTHDGRNFDIATKDFKIGDSVLVELPSQKVIEHLKLEPKMVIYLVGGNYAGSLGTVQNVSENKITYKEESGGEFETLKKYAFVVGKTKPMVTLYAKQA